MTTICTRSINISLTLFFARSLYLSLEAFCLFQLPSRSLQLRPILQCAYIQHNIAIIKYSSVWSQFWHDSYSINSFSIVLLFFLLLFFFLALFLFLSLSWCLHHLWERLNAMTKLWEDPWNKFGGLYTHTHTLHGWAELMAVYWYAPCMR